jgi:hypothetical protein
MAQTRFSGPVKSDNGFEGTLDTQGAVLTLATPTDYATGESLTADAYLTFTGQDGNTYYIPVSTTAPA